MLHKTKGIVLHQLKYTDSGIIVQVYTRDFGRISLMVKGMRSKKSGKHNVLFQPVFILETVIYHKASRNIQMLKEFSVSYSPANIYADIKKSCIVVFIAEILTTVVKEETPNFELYDFLEGSIKYLDNCESGYANFHIAFLSGLSSYLGFEPGTRKNRDDVYFDLVNGTFVPVPPSHSEYVNPEISDILAAFFLTSYDGMKNIPLTGSMRNEVLGTLIRYFRIHLPVLKKINSLEVLKEIFI